MTASDDATFASLGLRDALVQTLAGLGYEAPTPIQARTIPPLLAGGDLIGQAQTGTGKTAAFALPILERLDPTQTGTQALILAPTRELAMQVAEAIHTYSRGMQGVTVLPVYGGAPIVLQMKHLRRGAQIVVGTPGRLIDHLDRQTLDLSGVRMVVLDEADEMLKMGFIEEVERILSSIPSTRQIALFSATMPDAVSRIAQRYLHDPVRVETEHKEMTAPAIEQRFLNLSEGQKLEVLTQILELEPSEAALIFRRTKTGAAELAEKLEARGFAAVAMHGDMTQALREGVIRRLRGGQIEIVVATDVAARGLDVEQISHVINYDVPNDVEAYVHRIGRTGRAGRSGVATLFITPRERRMMREIERYTGSPIKPMKMPTRADVAARRISVFKDNLRKDLQLGDLDLYVELVEQLAEEGPFDMAEVAAAAARLANGSRSLAPEAERHEAPAARPQRAAPPHAATKPPAPSRRMPPSGEGRVRLSMAVGKRDGVRPADIVGSIANEADVPGSDIGPIDIREDITYVVIPAHYVEQVLAKVGRARFRGRPVEIKVAGEGEDEPRRVVPPSSRPSGRGTKGYAPRHERPADRGTKGRPEGSGSYGRKPDYPPRRERPADRGAADRREAGTAPRRSGGKPDYPPRRGPRTDGPPDRPRRPSAPFGRDKSRPFPKGPKRPR
jgi:ATP-dependent RNA helicase DeaD